MKVLLKTFSNENTCLFDIDAPTIESAIAQTIQHLVDRSLIAPAARDEIIAGLTKRERAAPTAIGNAVAVPHCYLDSMTEQMVVFVRLKDGMNLGAPDHVATRYLFILLGPKSAAAAHLDTLALIARLMSDDEFRYDLGQADSGQSLKWALERAVQRSAPAAPTEKRVPDGLAYSG